MNTYSEEESTFLKELGKKISEFRKKKDLTQEQFAKKSGIDRSDLARIEVGGMNSSVLRIRKIAEELDVPFYKLVKI